MSPRPTAMRSHPAAAFNVTTVELSQSSLHLLNSSISFSTYLQPLQQLTQTTSETQQYAGLLYTPSISSKCVESMITIPHNLSLLDLPTQGYPFIALAPASNCHDYYVQQATFDGARAIILYQPSDASLTTITNNQISPLSMAYMAQIPVYLSDFNSTSVIAQQMNAYNTGIRDVPYGDVLSRLYPDDAYVRLALTVTRSGPSPRALPTLWIFLLVVLGLLCLIVASTSIAMVCYPYALSDPQHLHQFLARRDLRRRIATGEVDLEGLGIKRLTVPRKYIEALSQRVWKSDVALEKEQHARKLSPIGTPTYGQTSCSICLEDYQDDITQIRELPCHHVFHPDCIDPFLSKRSSLCPLCKQSVLPKGYIPPDSQLTAATVMRERRQRRQAQHRNRISPRDIELQSTGITPAHAQIPNIEALAPDNEEEERELSRRSRLRRAWITLFPSRNI